MQIDLNDRDQAVLRFMISQTIRQLPLLREGLNTEGKKALEDLAVDANNLLTKLAMAEHLEMRVSQTWPNVAS